ncbi:MAG: hypothetical protein U9Q97_10530 [Acidobacteriota bacterium]|nr:hypothetical protein [Acidobacteriota bacterium]
MMIEDVRPEGCICEPSSDIRCYAKARAQDWLWKTKCFDIINPRPKKPGVHAGLGEKRRI